MAAGKKQRVLPPASDSSDHLAEDLCRFVEREGAQCLGAHLAARGHAQRKRGCGLVVRRVTDRNDVVPAKRPIHVLDSNAALLGHLLEGVGGTANPIGLVRVIQ